MPAKDKSRKPPSAPDPSLSLIGLPYKKSNTLILAKGHMTLLSEKLFALGLLNVSEDTYGNPIAVIKGSELKRIFGVSSNSLYEKILLACEPGDRNKSLLDIRIIYTNPEEKTIEASNLITDVKFKDATLTIRFNPTLKKYILGVRSDFTILNLKYLVRVKSIYSYRLYELIKRDMDIQRNVQNKAGPYMHTYSLTELKLLLGVVNIQDDVQIRRELLKSSPDFDKIRDLALKNLSVDVEEWSNFRRYALERAKKDLDSIKISFDYIPVRTGKGGKVTSVTLMYDSEIL